VQYGPGVPWPAAANVYCWMKGRWFAVNVMVDFPFGGIRVLRVLTSRRQRQLFSSQYVPFPGFNKSTNLTTQGGYGRSSPWSYMAPNQQSPGVTPQSPTTTPQSQTSSATPTTSLHRQPPLPSQQTATVEESDSDCECPAPTDPSNQVDDTPNHEEN
jgi:hypothetical protein